MASERGFPNETMQLLMERASVRNFSDKEIPPKVLERVFEAGVHAPTAGNLQPYSIIKITDPKVKRKLAKLSGDQAFVASAPVDLLFCIDWYRLACWAEAEIAPFTATSSFRHFWVSLQDTVICAQNIATAADSLGLGSVYVGTIMESFRDVCKLCHLPQGVFPVVLLCLGYPASTPAPAKKLGPSVVVHDETYHKMDETDLLNVFDAKYEGRHREITEERLRTIEQVCGEVYGQDFADLCLERIQENGFISPAQTYFGLHYRANAMPRDNPEYLKLMEDMGFAWFKPYQPRGQ